MEKQIIDSVMGNRAEIKPHLTVDKGSIMMLRQPTEVDVEWITYDLFLERINGMTKCNPEYLKPLYFGSVPGYVDGRYMIFDDGVNEVKILRQPKG